MGATGAMARSSFAAGLPIFRVACHGVFATAGLSVFSSAAVFAVLGAHLAIFAVAAVHRGLVTFCVLFAAGHLLTILALAAGLRGAGRVFFVIAAGTRSLFGIGGWRRLSTAALLSNGWQPGRESQYQYNRNHSKFHFLHLFVFFGSDMGNASHAASDTSDVRGGKVSEAEDSEVGTTSSGWTRGEQLETATLLTGRSKLKKRQQSGARHLRSR